MAAREILIGEVEDAVRKQSRQQVDTDRPWDELREAFIRATAAMILFIERGDKRAAAEEAKNQGTDS